MIWVKFFQQLDNRSHFTTIDLLAYIFCFPISNQAMLPQRTFSFKRASSPTSPKINPWEHHVVRFGKRTRQKRSFISLLNYLSHMQWKTYVYSKEQFLATVHLTDKPKTGFLPRDYVLNHSHTNTQCYAGYWISCLYRLSAQWDRGMALPGLGNISLQDRSIFYQ